MKDTDKIQKLKESIESRTVGPGGIIFVSENDFIPTQYINAIATINSLPVVYVNSLSMVRRVESLFGEQEADEVRVFKTDGVDRSIELNDYCYVICKSCSNNDFISVPNIEPWHIVDYMMTNSSGKVSEKDIKELSSRCSDIYSADNELSKYTIFPDKMQKNVFAQLMERNQFPQSKDKSIFEFADDILSGNRDAVKRLLGKTDELGIEPVALSAVLYNKVRSMLIVGFSQNLTEESTGLKNKQIYAIKQKLAGKKASDLIKQFDILCDVDVKLKKGLLRSDQLIDYLVASLM